MGTKVYVTNTSVQFLSVTFVEQGPTHDYDDKFTLLANTVPAAASRAPVLGIERGLTFHAGDAIDTAELQLSIDGQFIGAVVIMMDARGEPLKSELYWALRSASDDLTPFADDTTTRSLQYASLGYDVSASIAGESHGLGLYDIVVTIGATPTTFTNDITIDLKLQTGIGPVPQYGVSVSKGRLFIPMGNTFIPVATASVEDGTPASLRAACPPGASLVIALDGQNKLEVPLDGFKGVPLTVFAHAETPKAMQPASGTPIPITLISPPFEQLPPFAQQVPQVQVANQGVAVDLSDSTQRQWVIDTFGGALAYAFDSREYLWYGFHILDKDGGVNPSVVRANIFQRAHNDYRTIFSGYVKSRNPIFNSGFFGKGNPRFIALLIGSGTFNGLKAALKAGLVPSPASAVLLALSSANQMYSAYNDGAAAANIMVIPLYEYLKGTTAGVIASAFMSLVLKLRQNAAGLPRDQQARTPVVILVGLNYGANYVGGIIVDAFIG